MMLWCGHPHIARPTPRLELLDRLVALYAGGGGCNLVTGWLFRDLRPSVLANCVMTAVSVAEKTPELGTPEALRPPAGSGVLLLPRSLARLQLPSLWGVVSPVVASMYMLYWGPVWPGGMGQVPRPGPRPMPRGAGRMTIRTSFGSTGVTSIPRASKALPGTLDTGPDGGVNCCRASASLDRRF
jgi:hypothetical protein